MILIYDNQMKDSCYYNTPIVLNIAAIMIGDGHNLNLSNWDILLKLHDRGLQKISKLHPSYDPLHYVLLFLKDNSGWHINISLIEAIKRKRIITI